MNWQSILITGASSGLGWALAEGLACPGVKLLLTGRSEERLSQLALLAQEKGAVAEICIADLSTIGGQQQVISLIERELPDLCIHNAGIGAYGAFVDTNIEKSLEIIQVNVMAIMTLTHAWCHALLRHGKAGKVVFVSSVSAFMPIPGAAAYAASKAYLLSFGESLRFELKRHNIGVLTVCPGQFATNFQKRAAGKAIEGTSSEEARRVAKDIIRVLHKEGVYTPFSWRIFMKLRYFVPKKWLMGSIERHLVSRLSE